MALDLTIRQTTIDDLPVLVELNYALFQEDAGQRDPTLNLEWPRKHGHAYFADLIASDTSACLIAEIDGLAIGYLAGYTREPSDLRPIKTAELESMFVREAWRSRRVGEQLVQRFAEWAQAQGAQRISVTAYYANGRAVQFYQRVGFTPKHITLEARLV